MPQFRAIEAESTVRARDVIRFGLDRDRWGWDGQTGSGNVESMRCEVHGGEVAWASMGELAAGERHRLLFARARLSYPCLLLRHEPPAPATSLSPSCDLA